MRTSHTFLKNIKLQLFVCVCVCVAAYIRYVVYNVWDYVLDFFLFSVIPSGDYYNYYY